MDKGNVYEVEYTLEQSAGFVFRNELKLGQEADVKDMTRTVIPVSEDSAINRRIHKKGIVHINESGEYNFGLHDLSDAATFDTKIRAFKVSAGVDEKAPAMTSAMKVIPSPKGLLEAVVEIPTLAKNLADNASSEPVSVDIYRDSLLVKQFENVIPGTNLSYIDHVDSAGYYKYTVVPSNRYGKSFATEKTAFIGVNIPVSPQNLVMRQSVDGYALELSWDPVTKTVDGDSISPELVHYKILDRTNTSLPVVVDNLKENSYTCRAVVNPGQQKFAAYSVYAVTAKGSSVQSNTEGFPVGKKDIAPYKESFSNASLSHHMGVEKLEGDGQWTLCNDSTTAHVFSLDGDNGYADIANKRFLSRSAMFTGCVSLAGIEKPELTFGMFLIAAANNPGSMTVEVRDLRADIPQYVTVLQIDTLETYREQEGEYHWVTFKASLEQFKGKDIQVKFTGDTGNRKYLPLDNIQIAGRGFVPGHAADDVTVTGEQGYIYISGAENRQVEVYGIDGRCLYSGSPQCELNLLANAGIYVVKVGEASFKVIVK